MNFEFSTDQKQIKDEVRKVLADRCSSQDVRKVLDGSARFDRALWQTLGELGFLGVAIPEEYGGSGAGDIELCAIAEELGRAVAPIPFSSSIYVAADLILAAGTEAQKQTYLPKLASGEAIGCLAIAEGPGEINAACVTTTASHGCLTGVKWPVLDGDIADFTIIVARSDSGADAMSLFIVDLNAEEVSRSPLTTIDPTRSQGRIDLSGARGEMLGTEGDGWSTLQTTLDRAAVLTAFEQVGGAERALEMARDYALERFAFGRPIGSFQAIKHKLVDMYVSIILARANSYYGAWALSQRSDDFAEAAAAARVSATQAFQLCAKENIQIHGGMGFTWESDCHVLYRRAHLLSLCLGGLTTWQDRLIDQMLRHRRAEGVATHGF